MADDLIIKFFREDLTEMEEAALLERLSFSVEDALRFGQHAETSYLHYGLPEPQWRGGPPPPGFPPNPGFKLGLWLPLALLAGLSAWGAWKYWCTHESQTLISIPAASLPGQNGPILKKTGPEGDLPGKLIVPDRPESGHSLLVPDARKIQQSTVPKDLTQALSPFSSPINAAAPGHRPHTNLEVLVKRAKPGPVTVRVLEPDGTQAVVLYQGMLQPGSWVFDWNGRLADGVAPPAGTYQIQVASGAVTLNKPVVLRKQP